MKAQLKLTKSQIADYNEQITRLDHEVKDLETQAKLYALRATDAQTKHEQRYWSDRFVSTKHVVNGKKLARKQYAMAVSLFGA